MERIREAKRLRCEAQMDADILLNAAIADAFSEIGTHRLPLLDVLLEKPRNGWSPPCDNAPEGTPVLKLGAVLGFRFNPSAVKRTSLPVNPKAYYWLSKGDILISRSNTPELVAQAAVYSGEPNPCIYPDLLMRMRVEPSKADPQFIIYWLQSEEARTYIRAHAKGASSTMKKITQGDVCALPFPRIEVDDQRRIVAYLDFVQKQATALKHAQEDTDAELRRLEQAILDRAFRGEL
jgi:type I restriction enzyme S subunit